MATLNLENARGEPGSTSMKRDSIAGPGTELRRPQLRTNGASVPSETNTCLACPSKVPKLWAKHSSWCFGCYARGALACWCLYILLGRNGSPGVRPTGPHPPTRTSDLSRPPAARALYERDATRDDLCVAVSCGNPAQTSVTLQRGNGRRCPAVSSTLQRATVGRII